MKWTSLLILLVLISIGIWAMGLVPVELKDYAWSGFFLLCSLISWGSLALFAKQTAQAGEVLLELNRPQLNTAIGVVGIGGGFIAALASILEGLIEDPAETMAQFSDLSRGVFWFSIAGYWWFVYRSKWSIRQRGIAMFGQFLPWEKIEGFRWEEGEPLTLYLRVRKRFQWGRTVPVRIPADRRKAVSEILMRNLSVRVTRAG